MPRAHESVACRDSASVWVSFWVCLWSLDRCDHSAGSTSLTGPSGECARLGLPRRPLDALQQRAVDPYAQGSRQLHERVDARHACAALKQANLRAMKRSASADLFLAEVRLPAE